MPFFVAAIESMLETEIASPVYATLHNAQPDATGSNRISGAVQPATFAWNAGTGRLELQTAITFSGVTNPTHFVVWVGDPDVAGVPKGYGDSAVTGTAIDVILNAGTTYLDIV